MPKKTLIERCRTTLAGQKRRAKEKYGVVITYTAEDLAAIVPTRCKWCGTKLSPAKINFDHATPLGRGGEWSLDNLRAICASDNRRKGALTEYEYELLLKFLNVVTERTSDEYARKNILARLAAGGAWIHG